MSERDERRLVAAAKMQRDGRRDRNKLLISMWNQGYSMRHLGELAKMSHTAVRRIVAQAEGE